MPFVFTWDNVSPADPTAANLLGKDIRDLRSAIQERMDANFCDPAGPWLTSDPTHPIIPLAAISGAKTGKHITIPHIAFIGALIAQNNFFGGSATGIWTHTDLYSSYIWSGNPSILQTATVYAPVIIPIGCTITGLSIFADPHSANAMVCSLMDNVVYGTPAGYASGIVATATTPAASGLVLASSGAVAVSSTLSSVFYLKLTVVTPAFTQESSRIYGAQITYNSLDSTTVY